MLSSANFPAPNLYDSNRWAGVRVGLLGGSFNPVHEGHIHIARLAQASFGLNFVWWIVTPKNPLKDKKYLAPYQQRFDLLDDRLADYPLQIPTHIEHLLNTKYTYQTVSEIKKRYPRTDFLWISGMDNAHIFHRWDRWQDLLNIVPITFIARPPASHLVKGCPVRHIKNIPQYNGAKGRLTDLSLPGIYWLEGNKMLDVSSTMIRKSNKNQLFKLFS